MNDDKEDSSAGKEEVLSEIISEAGDEAAEVKPLESDDSEVDGFALPLIEVVEAILFAANEALPVEKIAKAAGMRIRREAVLEAIKGLQESYVENSKAFEIVEIAEKFQMLTRPEFAVNIQALYGKKAIKEEKEKKMSPAVLDTLAIIAYKQPVTRAEVEAVRGVGCGQIMRQLMERGSIKPVGKKMDVIGYPLLYGTTDDFLGEFGLASLDVLPMANELRRLTQVELPKPEIIENAEGESGDDDSAVENAEEAGSEGAAHSKLDDAVVIAGGDSENSVLAGDSENEIDSAEDEVHEDPSEGSEAEIEDNKDKEEG